MKFSTPSPKFSEHVKSPLTTAPSTLSPLNVLSPSKGVGIGATWSAALDELLNKPSTEPSTQSSAVKELGKETGFGSQPSESDSSKVGGVIKPAKIIIDREILSPELVFKRFT